MLRLTSIFAARSARWSLRVETRDNLRGTRELEDRTRRNDMAAQWTLSARVDRPVSPHLLRPALFFPFSFSFVIACATGSHSFKSLCTLL